jgi:hypothetical protein
MPINKNISIFRNVNQKLLAPIQILDPTFECQIESNLASVPRCEGVVY